MKKILFLLPVLLVTMLSAQPLRVHLGGGLANYSGDLQEKAFTLKQANGLASAGATFNITDKFALRSDYSFTKLGADDKYNTNPGLNARNLNFKTIIRELTIMGEYDIFDLSQKVWTPYVFAGVGGFKFSPYTTDPSDRKIFLQGLGTEGQGLPQFPDRKLYNRTEINIPFGGGFKYALSDDIHLSAEMSFRKLFTDYLDDVSTTYVDENVLLTGRGQTAVDVAFRGDELKTNPQPYPAAGTIRGKAENNDLYYFVQARISFRLNWLDSGGFNNGGRKSKVGCPIRIL
jgi:opacity protein-like surface antigen